MKRHSTVDQQTGFTIIELMIATAILSTMILIVTVLIVNIGNLYYKGINQSRIQDTARSISDQISQDLKYNGGRPSFSYSTESAPNGSTSVYVYAYCVGNIRYTYVIGNQIGSGNDTNIPPTPQMPHVLWRDDSSYSGDVLSPNPLGSSCPPVNLATVNSSSLTQDPTGPNHVSKPSASAVFP